MTDNSIHEDPAAIERDIQRTQEEMSRTVDRIGDQLTVKNIFNALLDKADENGVDAHYLLDGARRNPMALGLIAAGAIWLVSDKDAQFPSLPSGGKKPEAGARDELDLHGSDVHHRDYVSHMSSLEMRDGEDWDAYQRRRDLHRANFLMCERAPNEDESSFRQRLDNMTEKFREKRRAWMDSASQTSAATRQRTQELATQASTRAQDMYSSNPLVGGILAAAVGAVLGSTIPVSRQEQETLGSVGVKARELASEQKDQLTSKAMEKKDELLEKVDEKVQPQGEQHDQGERQQALQTEPVTPSGLSEQPDTARQPSTPGASFILSDRDV